jgi:hypothetical protein
MESPGAEGPVFSKELASHIGAIWYFIHDDNQQHRAQLGLAATRADYRPFSRRGVPHPK